MVDLSLKKGIEHIQEYPAINHHFNRLDDLTEEEYILSDNIIIRWLKFHEDGGELHLVNLNQILGQLNELIKDPNFTNQLTSSYDNGLSSKNIWREIIVINYMFKLFGVDNIELYPKLSSDNVSDIKIKQDDVYIEVGDLQIPTSQKKINNIVNNASIKLSKINKKDVYVITIDTRYLKFTEGHFDVEKSTDYLIDEISTLFDEGYNYSEIIELNDKELIKNIYVINKNQSTVIVKPDNSSSAEETQYSESALITKILNHLKEDFKQLEPNSKNIVWYFVDDFYSSIWDGLNQPAYLRKVHKSIQGINSDLSGIIIKQKSGLFSDIFYLPNDMAGVSSQINRDFIIKIIQKEANIFE